MKYLPDRWAVGIGLSAALLCLPVATSFATPTLDGEKDAEYTSVATAPADKLVVDPLAVPTPINDTTDPRTKTLLATGMSATNTGTDLYIYIDMPNLDLNVIEGEWAIVFHLGGPNDGVVRTGVPNDPYGAACSYMHTTPCNAVLKSNMAGFKHDYDGNQGWSFLNAVNTATTDWDWENSNFLGGGGWTYDTANNLVHGVGTDGGEVVYKGGKGIEMKVPLRLFAVNPANTALVPPKPGDPISMQFYDNIRNRTGTTYPRGCIYSIPYEAAAQGDPVTHDYASGVISEYAPAYTLKVPVVLEVGSALLMDPATDLGHFVVAFTKAVGDGAATAANYAVVNKATGATLPVTSAVVDPTDNTRVILGVALPFNSVLRVTVSNVKDSTGSVISTTKNVADLNVGTGVQFNLYDPHGVIAAVGSASKLSMTGDPISWRNSLGGANEFPVTPVSGETGHWKTPVIIIKPGVMGYKYRLADIPDGGNWDDWNSLNPNDRKFFVPATSNVVQVSDNAAGSYNGTQYDGGPVDLTFTLIDKDNKAAGRPVYVTGTFNGWSGDSSGAIAMTAVAGQPNTYTVTFPSPAGNGVDITMKYKYLLIYEDPAGSGIFKTEWDLMNPFGDHWANIKGSGTPLAQSMTDYLGSTKALRILRAVAGIGPAPGWSDYYADLDTDQSGSVTVLDAVKALKG